MLQDAMRSRDHFYFAGITFYTVGCGDICPMGLSRKLALLNAFSGNFFSVVKMAMVIYLWIERIKG